MINYRIQVPGATANFIKESAKYITIKSLDNLMNTIKQDNLDYLSSIDSQFTMSCMIFNSNIYLLISIEDDISFHEYMLKFDNILTAKYLFKNEYLFKPYIMNIKDDITSNNISIPYDEPSVFYNGYQYNIVVTLNESNSKYYFSIVDSATRESVLSITKDYESTLKVSAFPVAHRFKHINKPIARELEIDIDTLPEPIKNQILATAVKLSLN
jgi:hypothetical protein